MQPMAVQRSRGRLDRGEYRRGRPERGHGADEPGQWIVGHKPLPPCRECCGNSLAVRSGHAERPAQSPASAADARPALPFARLSGDRRKARKVDPDGYDAAEPCSAGWAGPRPQRHRRGLRAEGAFDDDRSGPPQAARVNVTENQTPSRRAFVAHVPDRDRHILPIPPHTDHGQDRDIGGGSAHPESTPHTDFLHFRDMTG